MAGERTEKLIEALHRLESEGDLEPMVSLFAPDAELQTPTNHPLERGPEGARHFWDAYRRTFREVHSEIRRVYECGDSAVLEWTTRGRTTAGADITYEGVSIADFEDDRIRRFRSYFDPRRLGAAISSAR